MPVSVTSNAITAGAVASTGWPDVQPESRRRHPHTNAPSLGELDRVREQILQNLLEALGVGDDAAQIAIDPNLERKTAPLGFVTEWADHRISRGGSAQSPPRRPKPCRIRSSKGRGCR